MARFVLDSTFIKAIYTKNDSNHYSAVKFLNGLDSKDRLVVPVAVIQDLLLNPESTTVNLMDVVEFALPKIIDEIVWQNEALLKTYVYYSKLNIYRLNALQLNVITTASELIAQICTFDRKLHEAEEGLRLKIYTAQPKPDF